jgi:uncharacterized protein
MNKTTVIVGASDKEDRYSYKAFKLLQEKGHGVLPVHPKLKEIEGIKCFTSVKNMQPPDTVTVYVRPQLLSTMVSDIINLKPKRVVFNPGTEDADIKAKFAENGIETVEACTLVMLKTKQY